MTRIENITKTALKNQYIFEKMFMNNEGDVLMALQRLSKKYGSPARIFYPLKHLMKERNDEVLEEIFAERKKKFSDCLLLLRGWPPKKRHEFIEEIDHLLSRADFGHEWWLTFVVVVLQSWFFPPMRNLEIRSRGDACKKRVVLELNPDTSIDDIKSVWSEIQRRQKKLWPNYRRINLTKKSFTNLSIYWRDLEKRFLDNTAIDQVSWKNEKLTDLNYVAAIWPNEEDISSEADKRRMENLRQIRHRQSKKRDKF